MSSRRVLAVGFALGVLLTATFWLSAQPASAGILDASWLAPTQNTDGSPLTDLSSYRVYYGTSNSPCPGSTFFSVASPTSTPLTNQTVSLRLTGLTPGATYFVSVSALDSSGNQSPCSASASAAARSDFAVSPSGAVNFGNVNMGTFVEQTFTVSNVGGGSVSGTASVPLPFTIVSGSPFSLSASVTTQAVRVRFTPSTTTTVSATLSFTANGGTISSVVTGTGVPDNSDTTKPTVSITSPSGSAYSTAGSSMTLQGTAADNVGVTQVTWVNSRGGSGTATGTTSWTASGITLQSGANVLTVTARDAAGNTGTTSITATSDNTAPTVSITAPASSATVAGTVTVSANASDNIGVAGVQFFLDGVALGAEKTTAPFSVSWTTSSVSDGGHTLSARARDAVGNTTTSANVAVTVSNVTPPPSSPPPPPTANGLVAAYGFGEGGGNVVGDASGNGNTGSIGSGISWINSGRFGKALSFNGTGFVTIPSSASLNLTKAMTLEAWVRPTGKPSKWNSVVMKEQPNEMVYALFSGSQAKRPYAYFNTSTTSSGEKGASGSSSLPYYEWSHLTGTYDGVSLKLYVNGKLVRSMTTSGTIMTSDSALRIGGSSVWNAYFQGSIDEVRIYNRALSEAEIQTDMNNAVVGGTPTVDKTPPAIAIVSPGSGSSYSTNSSAMTLGGTASDNVGVTQVTWTNSRGGSGTASGTTKWSASIPLQTGANLLTVTARDAAGNTSSAALTANYNTTAPAVQLTSPTASAIVSGQVTVAATASSTVGLTGVQFLLDGGALGSEQFNAPFALSWASYTASNGTHTLSARVRDKAGNTTVSAGVTVTVSNSSSSPSPTTPLLSGLVAAYTFSEGAGSTVADTSGNNNHGTITGGAVWTTAGRFGSALVFNGSSSVVTVPSSPSLQLTAGMTLEAWVYPTAPLAGWRSIVDKNVDRYYLMASSDSRDRPAVGGTWGAGNRNVYGGSVLPVNAWTHLAATFDGTTTRLYVNGVLVASQTQTTPLTTSNSTLQIGGNAYLGENFAGRIDEVRVYNRALSQSEIQNDMNTSVAAR